MRAHEILGWCSFLFAAGPLTVRVSRTARRVTDPPAIPWFLRSVTPTLTTAAGAVSGAALSTLLMPFAQAVGALAIACFSRKKGALDRRDGIAISFCLAGATVWISSHLFDFELLWLPGPGWAAISALLMVFVATALHYTEIVRGAKETWHFWVMIAVSGLFSLAAAFTAPEIKFVAVLWPIGMMANAAVMVTAALHGRTERTDAH